MLNRFFETNIGQTLTRAKLLQTPYQEPFGGSVRRVFGKRFVASVLDVDKSNVKVHLIAQRLAISGDRVDNREDEFGDFEVELKKLEGLEDFWKALIEKADPEFNAACGNKG